MTAVRSVLLLMDFQRGLVERAGAPSVVGAAHGGDSYHQDHPATQVHASLAPQDGEPVILKRRVSAFTGSDREGVPPPGPGHQHRRVDRGALTRGRGGPGLWP